MPQIEPMQSGSTALMDRPREELGSGEGILTHIVKPPEDGSESAVAYVTRARFEGFEVEALCGYRWIPQRDPKQHPVCQKCVEIHKGLYPDYGDPGKLKS